MNFTEIIAILQDIAWGPWMLILLVGTGVYFTVRLKLLQFSKFGYAMKNTIGKVFKKQQAGKGELTPFQAVTTALAATVGTGNIAGVTGAIVVGGPGAVFWMWLSALFGMLTKYAEVVLAVRYRERNEKGDWVGGPMYYIKNGLGKKWSWLAVVFCAFAALAAFGIGNMTQVNTIASSINTAITAFGGDPVSNAVTGYQHRHRRYCCPADCPGALRRYQAHWFRNGKIGALYGHRLYRCCLDCGVY